MIETRSAPIFDVVGSVTTAASDPKATFEPEQAMRQDRNLNGTKALRGMQLLRNPLTLASIILLVAGQIPCVAARPVNQSLQAYVASPAHQAETVKAAQSSARWRTSGCSNARPFAPSTITYASASMSFGPDGAPLSGIWMERVVASGCGRDVLLNVAWIVANGRLSGGGMAPGATRADPILETDIAKIVVPLAQARVPPCAGTHVYIYDTIAGPIAPGAAPGSWAERWTIASCNKHVTIPISFTPDGKGGTNYAVQGDAAIVE